MRKRDDEMEAFGDKGGGVREREKNGRRESKTGQEGELVTEDQREEGGRRI